MTSSLLALINFIAMLLVLSGLAQAIARNHWQGRGLARVFAWIILAGQVWLIPQAISLFGFHSTRFLYPLWFGNWLGAAVSVILFSLLFRPYSRDLVDAARLDGLGGSGLFRHVVWPMARPAFALLAIILVMATWSEFVRPFLPTRGSGLIGMEEWPMPAEPQAIAMIVGSSILVTLPVIGLFCFARRRFLRVLGASAN